MSDAEVLFERRGAIGLVTLNRPKALNALTLGMVRAMTPQLKAWAEDVHVKAVVVRSTGERGFCAGGDIRALYKSGIAKDSYATEFWGEEYQLNTLIKEYPKPYVALTQGVVMGGGVGLSVHGTHRVACETTMLAMPESGIGLFPDVGGTYFLPRLAGRVGLYLALTGARLKAADLRFLGISTHIAAYADFDAIVDALAASGDVDAVLRPYAEPVADAPIAAITHDIDAHFGGASVEEVVASLAADPGEWAQAQAAIIRSKSPTSLKIAFRQMQEGRLLPFRDCMRLEFRITQQIQKGVDFYEGVRATIIEKDGAPKWSPATLEEVKPWMIDAYFAPLAHEWSADDF
ncbi:Fatty acid oxidation complex subunit alpha [Alphaproteobacteria bacterium SO-S41]|nr:Fatty acid oxidation complex subunit alpha [Alphaproteobacteria bacterium SO-S41]